MVKLGHNELNLSKYFIQNRRTNKSVILADEAELITSVEVDELCKKPTLQNRC